MSLHAATCAAFAAQMSNGKYNVGAGSIAGMLCFCASKVQEDSHTHSSMLLFEQHVTQLLCTFFTTVSEGYRMQCQCAYKAALWSSGFCTPTEFTLSMCPYVSAHENSVHKVSTHQFS